MVTSAFTIPSIVLPVIITFLEYTRAKTTGKVIGFFSFLASFPLGIFTAMHPQSMDWIFQAVYFMALCCIGLMSTQAIKNKVVVMTSLMNALCMRALQVYSKSLLITNDQLPVQIIALCGVMALCHSYYALSRYETDTDMHELASISYFIVHLSNIKSTIVKNVLGYLAILPGAPLQLGLVTFCAISFTTNAHPTAEVLLILSKLFLCSLMYSLINVTMYFSLTITPTNIGYAWLCLMNVFVACGINRYVGEFETVWFMSVLGLFGWIAVRLWDSPENVLPSAVFGGKGRHEGLKKSFTI